MKDNLLQIRINQCLELAKASPCPRRKFGAMIVDPVRNVVLMDGFNGGPRGAKGDLCGGDFCVRTGLKLEELVIEHCKDYSTHRDAEPEHWRIVHQGKVLWRQFYDLGKSTGTSFDEWRELVRRNKEDGLRKIEDKRRELAAQYPGVKSGTHMEQGCHHAEFNSICNAAASGVKTAGALLIVTGEPCLMCAKAIHHAGITSVVVIAGGYVGENGMAYLKDNHIHVREVSGPQDTRVV